MRAYAISVSRWYRIVRCFFFSSRRRHTRCSRDWSSDVCSSDLLTLQLLEAGILGRELREENFTVVGFPCNQFAAQEPGSEAEIAAFCRSNYQEIGRASCRERV